MIEAVMAVKASLRRDMHLSPHWVKYRFQRLSVLSGYLPFELSTIGVRFREGFQVDLVGHCLEECGGLSERGSFSIQMVWKRWSDGETYRFGKPSCAAEFEPTQMSTTRSGTEDPIRRLLHFLSRQRFTCSYWIVFGMDCQEWDSDGKQRIHRRSVTIIGSLCWIPPCRTLHMSSAISTMRAREGRLNDIPIKFVEIFDSPDKVRIDLGVLGDLVDVAESHVLI